MSQLQLSKIATEYEPALNENGKYFDDPKKYEWSVFQECGVKCPCIKFSKTIHRNKNNFNHQHCFTQKHLNYIKKLNENKIEKNGIDEKNIEREFKKLKVQIGTHHQNYLIQKTKNELLETQLTDSFNQIKELKSQAEQNDTFIMEQRKVITELKKNIDQYENIGGKFIELLGYNLVEDKN
tara:strand:+ start:4735 stop:5277 length:543 start_codon:yes stop_codon:yes gene_type:complete